MTSEERLRRRYRPEPVRVLLVGESPPASGRHFYAAIQDCIARFETRSSPLDYWLAAKIFANTFVTMVGFFATCRSVR
jgi:hypothetical protein